MNKYTALIFFLLFSLTTCEQETGQPSIVTVDDTLLVENEVVSTTWLDSAREKYGCVFVAKHSS